MSLNLQNELNDRQLEAALQTEGPVLILAGAGSGKTRVLTYRAAHLTEDLGVLPQRILAITFTNKAAEEMRNRIENLLGLSTGQMWIMTFHAMCVRILKTHGDKLGYPEGFIIYDAADQKAVMRKIFKERNITNKQYTIKGVLAQISKAKDSCLNAHQFALRAKAANNMFMEEVAQCYFAYERILQENQAMDFDDLLVKTVDLFESYPDILGYYQQRFQYIMVDEYQDTNAAQYKLVKLLAAGHRNLCVVGDDDQSIYRFRGADIGNILGFEKDYPDAKVVRLEQNYRSSGNILKAANAVIANNTERKEKTLWTRKEDGEKLRVYRAEDDREEANFICKEVNKLKTQGCRLRDIAILYRINAQSRALEEAMMRTNTPYQIFGGTPFYQRKEIKDITAYLRFLVKDYDLVSAERIINVPARGIGDKTVERLFAALGEKQMGLSEYISGGEFSEELKRSAKALSAFNAMVLSWRRLMNEGLVTDLINKVIDDCDYLSYLRKEDEPHFDERKQNIDELLGRAIQYEEEATNRGDEVSLAGFLDEIALFSSIDGYDENTDALIMMTLHSAKGLEFPVVFMSGMEDGLFPGYSSIHEDDDEEPDPYGGDGSAIQEERRLCYVGMTRAMKLLYLSGAHYRFRNGSTESYPPSRFLGEIPYQYLEKLNREVPNIAAGGHDAYRAAYEASDIAAAMDYTGGYTYENSYSKRAKNEEFTTPKENAGESFMPGDTVQHPIFGIGIVQEVSWMNTDYQVKVSFATVGEKKLFAKIAKLKKI